MMSSEPMLLPSSRQDYLDELLSLGVIEELDYHFARSLAELLSESTAPEVALGAALASRAVGLGHVCAELKTLGRARPLDREGRAVAMTLPPSRQWIDLLAKSELVGDGQELRQPLVLDRANGRLYLARYWHYQQTIQEQLSARAQRFEQVDGALLNQGLERYFDHNRTTVNDQRQAALLALLRNFAVITGGPGTGKTTTVTRILALIVEQALAKGAAVPKILLLAPTGKAAARLGESIEEQKRKLANRAGVAADVLSHIPQSGATIHRALGWLPDRPTRFNHHAGNPLDADLVLVDEVSMVDIGLLAKLLVAIPPQARLILLGDKDQLASVESGAILGDITGGDRGLDDRRNVASIPINTYSHEFAEHAARLCDESLRHVEGGPKQTGIWDSIAHLTKSHRFTERSVIGRLAKAIVAGQSKSVIRVLSDQGEGEALFEERDACLVPLSQTRRAMAELDQLIEVWFRPYLETSDPVEALRRFDHARLLCAHRHGPMGVEAVNRHVEKRLGDLGLIRPRDPYYPGRPVLVTKNDYQFNLFNGDIGLILRDEQGLPTVYFPAARGTVRALPLGHLPPHETVFAMTVHKSQGSEFSHIALLLPPESSPIITRELIYTAVTRAKHKVTIFGDQDVLEAGIKERISRASGLRDALWRNLAPGPKPAPAHREEPRGWQQLQLF